MHRGRKHTNRNNKRHVDPDVTLSFKVIRKSRVANDNS